MKAYRVTKDQFQIGDEIPAGYRLADLPIDRQEVEKLLESLRPPEAPCRTSALYVFRDLESAKKHEIRDRNSRLYLVEVTEILFEGDWSWCGQIRDAADLRTREMLAKEYWARKISIEPTIEWIVSKAVVKEELTMAAADKQKHAMARLGLPEFTKIG